LCTDNRQQATGSKQGPTHHGIKKRGLTNQKMEEEGKKKKLKSVNESSALNCNTLTIFQQVASGSIHVEELLKAYQRSQK